METYPAYPAYPISPGPSQAAQFVRAPRGQSVADLVVCCIALTAAGAFWIIASVIALFFGGLLFLFAGTHELAYVASVWGVYTALVLVSAIAALTLLFRHSRVWPSALALLSAAIGFAPLLWMWTQ